MANYKQHAFAGVVAGTIIVAGLNVLPAGFLPSRQQVMDDWQVSIGLIIVSMLFALWPDVDTNSKAQNIFYGVAFLMDILLIISGFFLLSALLGLLAMTPIVGKHRGWTHSKIAAFLVPSPIIIIPLLASERAGQLSLLVYTVSVGGYLSHLLLDGLIWKRIRIKSSWR